MVRICRSVWPFHKLICHLYVTNKINANKLSEYIICMLWLIWFFNQLHLSPSLWVSSWLLSSASMLPRSSSSSTKRHLTIKYRRQEVDVLGDFGQTRIWFWFLLFCNCAACTFEGGGGPNNLFYTWNDIEVRMVLNGQAFPSKTINQATRPPNDLV